MIAQFDQSSAYTTYDTQDTPVNTLELAKYLYGEWATHQDFLDPLPDDFHEVAWRSITGVTVKTALNIKPRPKWAALTAQQQEVWNRVAGVAIRIISGRP